MAEAFELGLRVLDVEGAGEAAFGGQCGDAAGEGGDRAGADLADFAECPPIFEMRVLELFLEALLTASPMSPSMLLPNPLPDGSTWTYATPMSCAAIVFPYS